MVGSTNDEEVLNAARILLAINASEPSPAPGSKGENAASTAAAMILLAINASRPEEGASPAQRSRKETATSTAGEAEASRSRSDSSGSGSRTPRAYERQYINAKRGADGKRAPPKRRR
ncbi:hypothetical protein SBOR_8632 [Sclerotinia borealis F-4128]|uniref:Uncharacterized protein n=1 Tax=Sclerotinia borealis (strain F-4128) TaxID=1432307 RepID=W9C5J2_SCLBF|nr:hypothetical protein SBOR_8632 [Sclerotinia borealis F-4128]